MELGEWSEGVWYVELERVFFFFQQKAAYEVPLGEWGSDVWSFRLIGLDLLEQFNICPPNKKGGRLFTTPSI